MKILRYRRPSVNSMLGITRMKRRFNKATGISAINRCTKPSRIKQRLKQKAGVYSPTMTVLRQTLKGRFPTFFGLFKK